MSAGAGESTPVWDQAERSFTCAKTCSTTCNRGEGVEQEARSCGSAPPSPESGSCRSRSSAYCRFSFFPLARRGHRWCSDERATPRKEYVDGSMDLSRQASGPRARTGRGELVRRLDRSGRQTEVQELWTGREGQGHRRQAQEEDRSGAADRDVSGQQHQDLAGVPPRV